MAPRCRRKAGLAKSNQNSLGQMAQGSRGGRVRRTEKTEPVDDRSQFLTLRIHLREVVEIFARLESHVTQAAHVRVLHKCHPGVLGGAIPTKQRILVELPAGWDPAAKFLCNEVHVLPGGIQNTFDIDIVLVQ